MTMSRTKSFSDADVKPVSRKRCVAATSILHSVCRECSQRIRRAGRYETTTRLVHLRLHEPDDADAPNRATAGRVRWLLQHVLRRWIPRHAEAAAADRIDTARIQAVRSDPRLLLPP